MEIYKYVFFLKLHKLYYFNNILLIKAVIYDLTDMNVYIAYGYKTDDNSFKIDAYNKAYVKLDMIKQFAVSKP